MHAFKHACMCVCMHAYFLSMFIYAIVLGGAIPQLESETISLNAAPSGILNQHRAGLPEAPLNSINVTYSSN